MLEKSFPFMSALYSLSNGNVEKDVSFRDIIAHARLDDREGDEVGRFLFENGQVWQPLPKLAWFFASENLNPKIQGRDSWSKKAAVRLTILGKRGFMQEYARRKHGSPEPKGGVVNNNYNISGSNNNIGNSFQNSSIQQGTNQSTLSLNQINDIREILTQLQHIAYDKRVSEDDRRALMEELKTIKENADPASLDKKGLKRSLENVVTILTSLSTIVASKPVLDLIGEFLQHLHF